MSNNELQPIFIFSLPRSGSTLLQRIMVTHQDIATTSEPWILLPLLFSIREEGVLTKYSHATAARAITDFYKEFSGGLSDYFNEIQRFVCGLYMKAAKRNVKYFLDKTPRYHLVVNEIIDLFPEGKFIYLWRNPLAIIASMVETWMNGKWHIYRYKVDLYEGLANLISSYHQNQDRVYSLSYEALLRDPQEQMSLLFNYLGLEFDVANLSSFQQVELKGRYGDPTGTRQYLTLSKEPLQKWKTTLSNPLRKSWCVCYLHWIGSERLGIMGYNLEQLIADIGNIPFSLQNLGNDLANSAYGGLYSTLEPHAIKHKLKVLPNWHEIYAYS